MEERPDSALSLLSVIDGIRLTDEAKARHALLLSQAYDKNYIDVTDDSLVSIAVNYYNATDNHRNKMLAKYYWAVVHMNQQDFYGALSEALDVEKIATQLGDSSYLARTKILIARAYLFSYNLEGAEEYFNQSLRMFYALGRPDWVGLAFYNLANLEQYKRNFPKTLEHIDSVKKYMDSDADVIALEIFAHIGLEQYDKADSVYTTRENIASKSPQLRAYHLLMQNRLNRAPDDNSIYARLFENASHYDSIDIAFVANQFALLNGDYQNAWKFTELLRKEADNVISDLSTHSLYRLQIEYDKHEKQKISTELHHKRLLTIFTIIIALLVCIIFIVYLLLLKRVHKAQILEIQQNFLLVSSDLKDMQQEMERLKAVKSNNASAIQTLQKQVQSGRIAVQELFMDKYSWIEELGNIFLDAEISINAANRAMKSMKKRLDAVKDAQFLPQLIEMINNYRNNLITRITAECPSITAAERTIIALLCANLSTRIISFILDIKPQSVYNAKSSIKKKLESTRPELLQELNDLFRATN